MPNHPGLHFFEVSVATLPTSLRLPKQLKDFLWRRAQDEHRNLSQMIIHVLEMYRQSIAPSKNKTEG